MTDGFKMTLRNAKENFILQTQNKSKPRDAVEDFENHLGENNLYSQKCSFVLELWTLNRDFTYEKRYGVLM